MSLIVADASPLIAIAGSGLIPVLRALADEVIVPETVRAECIRDLSLRGAQAIRDAVEAGDLQVRPDVTPGDDPNGELSGLDAGELAAINLALLLRCRVLMDERLGRQAARRRGLVVIGSSGFLIDAKRRGLIPAVAPILDQWLQSGYFLSGALVKAVLSRAGEA